MKASIIASQGTDCLHTLSISLPSYVPPGTRLNMNHSTAGRYYKSLRAWISNKFADETEKRSMTYNSDNCTRVTSSTILRCRQDIPHLVGIPSTPPKWAYTLWTRAICWIRRRQAPVRQLNSPTPSILAKGSYETPSSAINRLSDEMLIEIMEHLDPASLYLLRQSSAVFLRLFGDNIFLDYHTDVQRARNYKPFAINSLTTLEQGEAAKSLQRGLYYNLCLEARNGLDWDARLVGLQKILYCNGCTAKHLRFFFYSESIENHKRGLGKLLYVGRLGQVKLCSHSTCQTTATWETIESNPGWLDTIVCTHMSHCPLEGRMSRQGVPAAPRLDISQTCCIATCRLAYVWDLPLLYIDQFNIPSLEAVHEALITLIEGNLNNQMVCKHILRGRYLRSFVRSGICPCFSRPGRLLHPFPKDRRYDCTCDRERYLSCKGCGAMFAWFLDDGHVVLMHRYKWDIDKPTGAAWLALLDEESYRHHPFGEDTRHILWCDTPQCAVGIGRRWESMVKKNLYKNWWGGESDYTIAKQRSEETGYRMPTRRD